MVLQGSNFPTRNVIKWQLDELLPEKSQHSIQNVIAHDYYSFPKLFVLFFNNGKEKIKIRIKNRKDSTNAQHYLYKVFTHAYKA